MWARNVCNNQFPKPWKPMGWLWESSLNKLALGGCKLVANERARIRCCQAAALPVFLEEVGVARGLPPDGCIYPVIGDVPAVIHQLLRVAGLQVGLSEQPEPVPCVCEREWEFGTEEGGGRLAIVKLNKYKVYGCFVVNPLIYAKENKKIAI